MVVTRFGQAEGLKRVLSGHILMQMALGTLAAPSPAEMLQLCSAGAALGGEILVHGPSSGMSRGESHRWEMGLAFGC